MRAQKNELRRWIDDFSSIAYDKTPEKAVDAAGIVLTLATLEPLCNLYPVRDRLDAIDQVLSQLPFREPVRAQALLAAIQILSGKDCLEMGAEEKTIRYGDIASDLDNTRAIFEDYSKSCAEHVRHLRSLAEEDTTRPGNRRIQAVVSLNAKDRDGFTEMYHRLSPVIEKVNLTRHMLDEILWMRGKNAQLQKPSA